MVISRRILLRNVSDKLCRENQNTQVTLHVRGLLVFHRLENRNGRPKEPSSSGHEIWLVVYSLYSKHFKLLSITDYA